MLEKLIEAGVVRGVALAADDEPDVTNLMREFLSATAGFKVAVANTPEEAIRKYRVVRPDVVFLDFFWNQLPLGEELRTEMHSIDPDICILTLTGQLERSLEYLDTGPMEGYLRKQDERIRSIRQSIRQRTSYADESKSAPAFKVPKPLPENILKVARMGMEATGKNRLARLVMVKERLGQLPSYSLDSATDYIQEPEEVDDVIGRCIAAIHDNFPQRHNRFTSFAGLGVKIIREPLFGEKYGLPSGGGTTDTQSETVRRFKNEQEYQAQLDDRRRNARLRISCPTTYLVWRQRDENGNVTGIYTVENVIPITPDNHGLMILGESRHPRAMEYRDVWIRTSINDKVLWYEDQIQSRDQTLTSSPEERRSEIEKIIEQVRRTYTANLKEAFEVIWGKRAMFPDFEGGKFRDRIRFADDLGVLVEIFSAEAKSFAPFADIEDNLKLHPRSQDYSPRNGGKLLLSLRPDERRLFDILEDLEMSETSLEAAFVRRKGKIEGHHRECYVGEEAAHFLGHPVTNASLSEQLRYRNYFLGRYLRAVFGTKAVDVAKLEFPDVLINYYRALRMIRNTLKIYMPRTMEHAEAFVINPEEERAEMAQHHKDISYLRWQALAYSVVGYLMRNGEDLHDAIREVDKHGLAAYEKQLSNHGLKPPKTKPQNVIFMHNFVCSYCPTFSQPRAA